MYWGFIFESKNRARPIMTKDLRIFIIMELFGFNIDAEKPDIIMLYPINKYEKLYFAIAPLEYIICSKSPFKNTENIFWLK